MPPYFTNLPQEIRDKILELCLVVEGPINAHPTDYEDGNPFENCSRKPDISLLGVSKAISAEAAETFYGKNTWVLNWSTEDEEPKARSSKVPSDKIWHIHREQIRHVCFSFDIQDLNPETLVVATRMAYDTHPEESSAMTRRKTAHFYRLIFLKIICGWKLNMCRHIGVESVTINIENLFCSDGCCRIEAIRRCCFDPLLKWGRMIEEARVNKDTPALPGGWHPKITLGGFLNVADITAAMVAAHVVWGRPWEPLNHCMNGDQICLDNFFLPREAKSAE